MNYIKHYNLKPADRILVPKSLAGIIQHHAIYLGQDYSEHDLIAENVAGKYVRLVTAEVFFQTNPKVTRVESFQGNNYDRRLAVARALKLLGKAYDLINFNCEHFASYSQTGKAISLQVSNGFLAVVALLFIMVLLND